MNVLLKKVNETEKCNVAIEKVLFSTPLDQKSNDNKMIQSLVKEEDTNQNEDTKEDHVREARLIPLQFNSDIYGRGGAWREWSCIWLAHLLYNAIASVSIESGPLTPIWRIVRPVTQDHMRPNAWTNLYKLKSMWKL